jgi:guanylate kinase
LVLDIDVQGARQLKVAIPEAISIFVLPPSREILEQRLRARSQDSEEVIQRRLKAAAEEVQNYVQYDYVLINREIEESAARLATIVRAERMREVRMEEDVGPILESFKLK